MNFRCSRTARFPKTAFKRWAPVWAKDRLPEPRGGEMRERQYEAGRDVQRTTYRLKELKSAKVPNEGGSVSAHHPAPQEP